jgi:hypothetical protein
MRFCVVDTNVAVVANGRDTHAGAGCQLECVRRLRELVQHGVVVLDQLGLILGEYRKHLRPAGQPGVGDAFLRHLFDHRYNPRKCELVEITRIPDDKRSFDEFPNDEALAKFDPDDRKFVATARASVRDAVILNATDSDWSNFEEPLARHGVVVHQLCPGEIARPDPRGRWRAR